jgi:hypothetical protein
MQLSEPVRLLWGLAEQDVLCPSSSVMPDKSLDEPLQVLAHRFHITRRCVQVKRVEATGTDTHLDL